MEPQKIGIWAIADRAVRTSLQGGRFQPIGTMGDRSWADSVHNKRNGVKVRSNRQSWQLSGVVGDGQDEIDMVTDWTTWKESLGDDERELVEVLEREDSGATKNFKGIKQRKRVLADGFLEFRRN